MRFAIGLLLLTCAWPQEQKWTYKMPADGAVTVGSDIEYRRVDGTSLKLDIYRPKTAGWRLPVVLFLNGVGSSELRKWPQYTGWGRLAAGAGLAAVTFDTREGQVAEDTDVLIRFLEEHASEYGIDAGNLLVYSCSANASFGVPFVMQDRPAIHAAVIYYGTAEIQRVRPELPVFVVRASWDSPAMNKGIDRMVTLALAANAPWEVSNVPAHHGFEVIDDTAAAHDAITRTLAFLKSAATPAIQRELTRAVAENGAVAALMAEDWRGAADAYQKLVAAEPENREAVRQLGEARLHLGDYTGALQLLERALAMGNPNRGWIAYSAAVCNASIGKKDMALEWLAQVPPVPGLLQRMRGEKAFDALRADPRFPAGGRN